MGGAIQRLSTRMVGLMLYMRGCAVGRACRARIYGLTGIAGVACIAGIAGTAVDTAAGIADTDDSTAGTADTAGEEECESGTRSSSTKFSIGRASDRCSSSGAATAAAKGA